MIWFVRHGETDFNKFGITQGQLDTSLNKAGIEQSKDVAKQLKDVSFDIAFCSTLIRADQTLQEILKYHNNLNVIYDKRLIEHKRGNIVGRKNSKEDYQKFFTNPHAYGGENEEDIYNRVFSFVQDLSKYKGLNVLIVSHGGISKYFKFIFEGKDIHEDKPISTNIQNCGVMNFDF